MENNTTPWSAFNSIEPVSKYNKEQLEEFAKRLFDTEDEEQFLIDYCFIEDCILALETIKTTVKPTVQQIVLNQPKTFEIAGYKFTYRAQTKYNYSESPMWVEANESVKISLDYQKQIEETCKKGGTIGGVPVEKVSTDVTDNFAMSKIKK